MRSLGLPAAIRLAPLRTPVRSRADGGHPGLPAAPPFQACHCNGTTTPSARADEPDLPKA